MRWIAVTERLPEGADAISCEAWCEAEEPGEVAGPCIMSYDAELDPLDPWSSREDTGCWEPGPVTHWRSRPAAPGQEDTMGVIGADGKKHHLFLTRAEEDAAVARSPLKVADDLITLAGKVGAAIPAATRGVKVRPVDECAPYLKEGETPSECIARNRKDAAAVFSYYDDAQRWRAVRDLLGEIETEFVKLEDLPAWIRKMQDSLREARNAGVTGAPAPSGWRPIDTAPKDGREVILRKGERVGAACWVEWPDTYDSDGAPNADGGEGWTIGWDGDEWREPDAWQPLPPAHGVMASDEWPDCPECKGMGFMDGVGDRCAKCKGTGRIEPAGAPDTDRWHTYEGGKCVRCGKPAPVQPALPCGVPVDRYQVVGDQTPTPSDKTPGG